MGRDPALAHVEDLHEVRGGQLILREQVEDPHPSLIRERLQKA